MPIRFIAPLVILLVVTSTLFAQETRLLRQPTLSETSVAFVYGGDLWIADRDGGVARRLTSTPATESHPHFSPDGRRIAFTSDRSGAPAVYVVAAEGGAPTRLTWYPASADVRGWTPDGNRVLYASSREAAPVGYDRLWTVAAEGGPSTLLPAPYGHDGAFSPDGRRLIVEPVTRWDDEFQDYRGGQNQPLVLLDLDDLSETLLPNERTTDVRPVWQGDRIYFLSDRDGAMNVWSYVPESGAPEQVTQFAGSDVKWLDAGPDRLVFEREGFLFTLNPDDGAAQRIEIEVRGDFPWAQARWENVADEVRRAALSPSGKRAVMEARGEIFTVPVEYGDPRNLTRSSDAADRAPVWSPEGGRVAWFSDAGGDGYALLIGDQDGLAEPRRIEIGPSKLGWEPTWAPDGRLLAFVDDDVRIRVVDVQSGDVRTVGVGGTNVERGNLGLTWSPDSKWLAYARTAPNMFRRITVWSAERDETIELTDALADAFAPAWDRDGRHLYFLASTDLALGAGWANTSSMKADPAYGAYVAVLRADDPSPFLPRSDEEPEAEPGAEDTAEDAESEPDEGDDVEVRIDVEGLGRRILALPMPVRPYAMTLAGPGGTVFIGEGAGQNPVMTLHKFDLQKREAAPFVSGVRQVSVSADAQKLLFRQGDAWRVVDTAAPPGDGGGETLDVELRMQLDRQAEWGQMFEEAWRYERDYFYDPGLHGRDWQAVHDRYAPLVPYVRHRSDLTYLLDQMNGELSVGHSFVFGGDYPAVDTSRVGLPGADFEAADGRWRIARIYTAEHWNPGLDAPLDRPGLDIEAGDYLVGVDGVELTSSDDPYRLLDGTAERQTVFHVNDQPTMDGARQVVVEPVRSETELRRRAWVEDNRRFVDSLSDGRLAYVWVPNTSDAGVVSFDRYFFAQQDKQGAVIDERFNGGGFLDDYMVDLMTRRLRAAITNEVPGGAPFRLPAGILGPKVLLINERSGSGGDFFPWVFRQQNAGPLIGMRTWGGLVKSSVHYPLVDGGALTAPDNAVFDPINDRWIAENEGVAPDIEVRLDARSAAAGRDPQLERAVEVALQRLDEEGVPSVEPPPFSRPAREGGEP